MLCVSVVCMILGVVLGRAIITSVLTLFGILLTDVQ